MSDIDKQLSSIFEGYRNSGNLVSMKDGESYYRVKNTQILNRSKKVVLSPNLVLDNPFAANHKIPNGFYRVLVDQKIQYLLGNGIDTQDNDNLQELDTYSTKRTFLNLLKDIVLEASNKGTGWLYFFKDKSKLKFKVIPSEQLKPVYDIDGNLIKMYRFYSDEDYLVVVEYTKDLIIKYIKKEGSKFELLSAAPHYIKSIKSGSNVISEESGTFSQIPFIKLKNDFYEDSDLSKVKAMIDVYDIIESDYACNIDDMQDAFFTLKGYDGDSSSAFEFLAELKATKAVPVAEDGSVDVHQLQVPVEAREKLLDRLRVEIFLTGMGVDTSKINGGSITNVLIRAMFSNLDLKCDALEEEIREFIADVLEFINTEEGNDLTFDYSFNRSLIVNKEDIVDSISKISDYKLSKESTVQLLPYDIDKEKEINGDNTPNP